MNVLVIGANGQLGRCIQKYNKSIIQSDKYVYVGHSVYDISWGSATQEEWIKKHLAEGLFGDSDHIDVIINCAAYTDVVKAEHEFHKADNVNNIGVGHLAYVCDKLGITLIHISTDYVYGPLYDYPILEKYACIPQNIYGKSKLFGDENICNICEKYIILRTSWLYSEYGNNFYTKMLNLLKKDELQVVNDQIGTPTYAMDLAKFIVENIKYKQLEGRYGIYNFSNEGVCSWFDFAMAIKRRIGSNCNLLPCTTEYYEENICNDEVERPKYSVLSKDKVKKTFLYTIPYWVDSLEKCMKEEINV